MKVMIIGDLHFGVKNDHPWHRMIQIDFFRQAIAYSKANGIKRWLQTGDWFDVRRGITNTTMEFTREMVEQTQEAGIQIDVIVGNHDAQFKNTIIPNSCDEILGWYENITVHSQPTAIDLDGLKMDMIPWICESNHAQIMEYIEKSTSTWCMGHFELNGFYFYRNVKSHGDDPAFLRRYKQVLVGHYHTQSEGRNIKYVGTPYTITFGDANDERGFHVLDTETELVEFVPNETMWHREVEYPSSINPSMYKNLAVRLLVNTVDTKLAKFESALEDVVFELKSVQRINRDADVEDEIDLNEVEEPKELNELMNTYIANIDGIANDDMLETQKMTQSLYFEAKKD